MRTPAGSACPPRSARASMGACPTPGAPSSTPTVRAGESQPPPRPSGPLASSPRGPPQVRGHDHSSHSVCSRGTWTCQQSTRCPSTCTLYGEGHVVTFDGQRFVFDGSCEYILVTVSASPGQAGAGAAGAAPPQRPLPTGRLRRQRRSAHLQDPDGERRVWELGRHLLPGHQDPLGGERRRAGPASPGAVEPGFSGPPSSTRWAAASPGAGQPRGGEGSRTSLTFSPRHGFKDVLEPSANSGPRKAGPQPRAWPRFGALRPAGRPGGVSWPPRMGAGSP